MDHRSLEPAPVCPGRCDRPFGSGLMVSLLPQTAGAVLRARTAGSGGQRQTARDRRHRASGISCPCRVTRSGRLISNPIVPAGGQYRHPSWSPDRTKVSFANGSGGIYDLFVIDLEVGTGLVQITP